MAKGSFFNTAAPAAWPDLAPPRVATSPATDHPSTGAPATIHADDKLNRDQSEMIQVLADALLVTPENQAVNIPDGKIKLPAIENKLTGLANWLEWERVVKGVLHDKQLSYLIYKKIPRPELGDSNLNSMKWYYASYRVAQWLFQSISPHLCKAIGGPKKDRRFADHAWEAIKSACHGDGVNLELQAYRAFTSITAADFDGVGEFTAAYVFAVIDAAKAGLGHNIQLAVLRYLDNIQSLDPPLVGRLLQVIGQLKQKHDGYNEKMFIELLREIQIELNTTAPSKNDKKTGASKDEKEKIRKRPPPKQRDRDRSHKPLNSPEHGITDEEHCQRQRALPNIKGKCAHCIQQGHSARTCPLLRPDLRRPKKRFPYGIWVYKRHENPRSAPSNPAPKSQDPKTRVVIELDSASDSSFKNTDSVAMS